jgi:predicted peptidase
MKNLYGYTALFVLVIVLFASCKKEDSIVVKQPPNNDQPGGKPDPNAIVETAPPIQKAVSFSVSNGIPGYQLALPARYDSTTKNYPLLIFVHGTGEIGNGNTDLWKVANIGVSALIRDKKFPPSFVVDGKNYSFIVASPQFSEWPTPGDLNSLIDHLVSKYRIDQNRVYVSGLSMGGGASWDFAAAFNNRVAAIVPICGASQPSDTKASKIASGKIAVWAFHNMDDGVVTVYNTIGFIEKINALNPAIPAKSTLWANGGHDAWNRATDPGYKENGLNMYEWMLKWSR